MVINSVCLDWFVGNCISKSFMMTFGAVNFDEKVHN